MYILIPCAFELAVKIYKIDDFSQQLNLLFSFLKHTYDQIVNPNSWLLTQDKLPPSSSIPVASQSNLIPTLPTYYTRIPSLSQSINHSIKMSGSFSMPLQLTGGAGYKANASYDEFLRKHSAFYRRHSAASNAQEADRRASQANIEELTAQAMKNVDAENAAAGGARRPSVGFQSAQGGAATVNARKGSVVVMADSDRKDSIFGMEATAGNTMDQNRRGSTSLAGDLYRKFKGEK